MSEKNLKGVPTNLSLSITRFVCCSHRTQLSFFFTYPSIFTFLSFYFPYILHASTIPFHFFSLVMVGWTYVAYVCIFTAFTVGWSVSGSDWPAPVYSFSPGYGQWQWPSGLRFLSLQVMACGRSHIGPFWFLVGF